MFIIVLLSVISYVVQKNQIQSVDLLLMPVGIHCLATLWKCTSTFKVYFLTFSFDVDVSL